MHAGDLVRGTSQKDRGGEAGAVGHMSSRQHAGVTPVKEEEEGKSIE